MTWQHSIPGLMTRSIRVDVPLDHINVLDGRRLSIFARVVALPGGTGRPYLLFLQGGPGHESPRPSLDPPTPAWLPRALEDYQLVFLDQRGTGLSDPVSEPIGAPQDQAEYLSHMRADEIVADCEDLREELGVESWAVLGQSFGGFTALHYLSTHPDAISAAYFTGGLPPVGRSADDVYTATYRELAAKSRAFYQRFPSDRDRMRRLVGLAEQEAIHTPNGDVVGPSRIRSLGHLLGASGGAERLHYLLENDPGSRVFRYDLADALSFGGRNPLYTVIHESSFADGGVTGWSAARVLPDQFRQDTSLLTGEHVFPEWFDEDSSLRPWRECAGIIADRAWPRLYDARALQAVEAPCAAAIYVNDAYVPFEFSMQTAALIPTMHPWATSQYEHNGSNASGGAVLDRLIRLARGEIAR
ncbi:alpha/beta fold hydrolase [Propionibacterium freudenreichii]|uniref:Proline iminopeptidase n=4 Tax=Propionibacterium freudenreichii TaxID=1744 RepID=D7GDB3_PROFC|nr:alpha/beta fold hydrolase [Propionibacterium freudenreichii]MDN5961515.1 alpha/beta hydrolase [Propionibacterium sp.]ARO11873.1 aminopeptidase [Propionibacterium freudenreichii]MCQ1997254.1 alpha/beta hydrolase [Propionibacterium freudenreichii]MCT2973538.1 alpha/beta fold hydrolase [Propionibacterium freudenreichii]MCT2976329.1 alpha/beta fold hydrolase [Propionibacterium freudenreichii]